MSTKIIKKNKQMKKNFLARMRVGYYDKTPKGRREIRLLCRYVARCSKRRKNEN